MENNNFKLKDIPEGIYIISDNYWGNITFKVTKNKVYRYIGSFKPYKVFETKGDFIRDINLYYNHDYAKQLFNIIKEREFNNLIKSL